MSSSKQKEGASDTPPDPFQTGVDSNERRTSSRESIKGKLVTEMVDKLQTSASSVAETATDGAKTPREGSPVRPVFKSSNLAQPNRSRKNSQDLSPTRGPTFNSPFASVPSAAAIQRAMSAQRPQILPGVDGVLESSRGDKSSRSGHNSPSWPTSPRLRSPPPSSSTVRNTPHPPKRGENELPPNIGVKRVTAASAPDLTLTSEGSDTERDLSPARSGLQTPASRGTSAHSGLETVAESSAPTTPSIGPMLNPDSRIEAPPLEGARDAQVSKDQNNGKSSEVNGTETFQRQAHEKSDNDSKGRAPQDKHELESKGKTLAPVRPTNNLARRSFTSLTGAKTKGLEPLRTMTVETETVSSIPQIIGGERGTSGRDGGGSVRTKPSTETIRPKKERKKVARKTPSLHAGTLTSKADIFEQKVASAVDQADSSDSDETFVYESNPTEARNNPHHSRTPSAASLASQQDQYPLRNKHGVRNVSQAISGKKSMKFTNSAHNNVDGEHGPSDSARGSTRNGNSTPRHHHIGRYSRTGHPSLFDNDSPFTQANKPASPRTSAANMTRITRPNSPRIASGRLSGSPRKGDLYAYDNEDDGADDERAPLIGSVRVNRNRHLRRPNSSLRQHDEPPPSCISRYGACIIITLVVLLLCLGAGTFIIALNKPLINVSIKHIQNVLASEQEIMLDLHVKATNPNLFAISVSDLDVDVFAESAYVGTADCWRKQNRQRGFTSWMERRRQLLFDDGSTPAIAFSVGPQDGVDEGTDPIDDPEFGYPKMLLGRVVEFDSPLVFDASPLRRSSSSSVGEIRLAKPGNKTEEGGTIRWERILQHPFDLIIRGVIKYQLPLSSKTRSVKIGSRVKVLPADEIGNGHDGFHSNC